MGDELTAVTLKMTGQLTNCSRKRRGRSVSAKRKNEGASVEPGVDDGEKTSSSYLVPLRRIAFGEEVERERCEYT